jgi:uncharacterized protein YbcI
MTERRVKIETERPSMAEKTSRAAQISRAVVQLMHEYTGRGPVRARTTLNTNVAAVVMHQTMTRGEQNLVDAGQRDAVITMRRTYHDAMRNKVGQTVADILGRHVVAVLSDIDVERDVAVVFFVLEPVAETGVAVTAEEPGDLEQA